MGPVDVAGEVPREVRRLRWSVFNVPLMWTAAAGDDDCAVLGWLSARAVNLPPMFVDSVQVSVAHWMARVVRYDAILGRELKGRFHRVDAQAGIREAQVGSAFQW